MKLSVSILILLSGLFSGCTHPNWKKHDRILDTGAVSWAEKAMWAPSVIKRNGKYFLILDLT